jgi:hypothetical protein
MRPSEVDAFICQRWRTEHAVKSIRFQLLMHSHNVSDAHILRVIRRYIDDASENVKINRDRVWLSRLRKALRRFQ